MRFCFCYAVPVLAACLTLGWAGQAHAQYPCPNPYPYAYPKVYSPYGNPGGYMAGTAQVINATGNFQIQQQKAQILHQQALQEQIKTQKMLFDWEAYKKANTPTYTQQQAAIKAMIEKRILTNPIEGEIVSGEALNILLPYLQNQANKGFQGPSVPLSEAILARINVTTPNTGGSAGLLKNAAKLDFPFVLKGETQVQLAALLPQTVAGSINGTLDFKLYKQCRATLDQLRQEHKQKFHKEEIDGGTYLVGTRFLDSLEDSVKMLEQPNAAKLLNGTYQAKGGNVAELVQNMIQQGLHFAPAIPGDEAAYMSLHSSMVSFATGGQGLASLKG